MKDQIFSQGNSAIVTGAALGIGRQAAVQLSAVGMNVALFDLPGDDLEQTTNSIRKTAAGKIISFGGDVSSEADWIVLSNLIDEEFGPIQFLLNNAVTRVGRGFDAPLEEWRKAIEINFWGVILGVQKFLPSMLDSNRHSAIVDVGSKQGITNPPGHPIYNIAKSAVKTYTEQLQHELRNRENCCVSAHLLVPGWTTIGKDENKKGAWLPEQVVNEMISRVNADDFYIVCSDDEVNSDTDNRRILWGAGDITENRPPLSRWDKDFIEVAKKACS